MVNLNSIKIVLETQEKSYTIAFELNNFLDTRAYNLITIIGIILSVWFFSLNQIINTELPYKTAILISSTIAIIFYISSVIFLLVCLFRRGFKRINPSGRNIEEYSKLSENDVYENLAKDMSEDIPILEKINENKALYINRAIKSLVLGIISTAIAAILTIWAI